MELLFISTSVIDFGQNLNWTEQNRKGWMCDTLLKYSWNSFLLNIVKSNIKVFFFYLHSFNSHRHYNSSNPLVSVVYSEFHFLLCKDSKCLIFSFPQYFKWAHCTNSVTNSVGVIFTGTVSKLILTNYLSRKRKTPFCPHPCCHELWMLFSYIEFPCIV